MAYTIKGLAKSYDYEPSEFGLLSLWDYWYEVGQKKQVVDGFKSLQRKEKQKMLIYMRDFNLATERMNEVFLYLVGHVYD